MGPYLLFTVLGFLSGSIMYSYWVPRLVKGIDIVTPSPDGNAGATNAMRFAGWPMGIACCLLDVLKGALPVFIAWHLMDCEALPFALVVVSPVLGHILAPFTHELGGKGISTSFGVLLGLVPRSWALAVFAICYVFFCTVMVIRPHELLSIVACICFSVTMLVRFLNGLPIGLFVACIAVALCVSIKAGVSMPDERHVCLLFRRYPLGHRP
jgi:glycerol-3-phosphate acyltransferase PlsY